MIVAFSVHQPSSQVFEMFDDLLLISGGHVVFLGQANLVIKFFVEAGFPCPTRRSPCDHFLRCVNTDFDRVMAFLDTSNGHSGAPTRISSWENMKTAEIRSILIEKYKQSAYLTREKMKTDEAILFQANHRYKIASSSSPSQLRAESLNDKQKDVFKGENNGVRTFTQPEVDAELNKMRSMLLYN